MALLASMLAYLGAATGIVVALLMSFDAFIYSPSQSTIPQQTMATSAKPSGPEPTTMPTSASGRWAPRVAHGVAQGGAVANMNTAADARRSAPMASATSRERYGHRLDRQARAKSWAYPQAPNVEPRAMGYAQESPFEYDRIR